MELLAAQRQYAVLHEERPWHDGSFASWAEKRSASHPYHFDDGVTIMLADTDVQPDDEFLTDEQAKPSRSATESPKSSS